ncbi:uncharacterized protein LOC123261406 [Cotesia glomerata]|uniref:uncharacterized protein LOC123261406 n=1 Tax=Cotesia glomerata TaxID=32391 RepID=UPI001D0196B7|nr:uncharacterized protein LOC123261406 [Cotesia glomerata]
MYKHQSLKLSLRASASSVISDTNAIWANLLIPTSRPQHSIKKLEKIHSDYMKLKNHRSRAKTSKRQRTNVEQFSKRLDKLFDIAALKDLPKNLQQFLTDCRKGNRNIHLPSIDVIPEETSENLSAMEVETPNNEEIGMKLSQQSSLNSFCSSISNSSELKRTCLDFEDTMPAPKKNKIDILTSELVLALDRTKTSNRNAMYIISAVIQSLGLEIDKYNLSYSTIRNARISKREEIVDTIEEEEIFDDSLVVHWDGKMLPAGNGQPKAERLSIHVTGINTDKNLKTPILSDGTGESQASAIFETLIEWDLCDNVKAMCFDTTSSNTEVAWPVTNSPNVPIFKRLRDNWEKIDKSAYEIGTEDKDIALVLNQRKDDILDFIENQLKNHHPRNDYKEFLELSCIFLGGIKSHRAEFKAPGAFHHARWLSKALYCLKIYMFRNQFKMEANEKKILQKICVFIVIFYVKIWFTAPNAINAPNSDLQLVKDLIDYRKIHPEIANAALDKLSRHLWYLHENLACLALFDETVSVEEKVKIVQK